MRGDQELSDVLVEFARTMVTDFSVQGILDHLVARVVELVPVTGAGAVVDTSGIGAGCVAVSDAHSVRFEQLQYGLADGPRRAAQRTGKALVVADSRNEVRFPEFASRALDVGLMSLFTFPLRKGIHPVGTLELYQDTTGLLSVEAMTAAQKLADVAAVYLFNAQGRAELQDSSRKDRYAALHDALTGLPNRILILERLVHAMAKARRSGKTSAVMFLDLDGFKRINDTYGHQVGDELLVQVARRMTALLRPGDTLARLSGDEFVILCEDLDNPTEAEGIVRRVHAALAEPFELAETEVTVTVSIGVAVAESADDSPQQILDDADAAMYRAKRSGGANVGTLDLREHRPQARRSTLEDDIRTGSWRGEMYLEYQPIVACVSEQVIGVETFLRWAHPTRGMVSPRVVVPLAEHCGLISEIGRWVLEQACTQQRRWQIHPGAEDLSIAVNVSAVQLLSPGFAGDVAAVLEAVGTAPRLLTLEIAERAFIDDGVRALLVLGDLKDMGVTLVLDHFETGHASLSWLKQFPIDILKIDRAFVAELGRDSTAQILVGAVVDLARDRGIKVFAEDVETAEQHHEVVRLGCDAYQGWHFTRPMRAPDLGSLVQESSTRK